MTLVNWPAPADPYRDTGEGGLFAYAVWDHPDTNCVVDAFPQFGMADVMVRAVGPLAETFERMERNYLRNSGGSYEDTYLDSLTGVGSAIFLGSTGSSLFNENVGEYFIVDAGALNDAGRTVVDALSAAYGSEPTFITYLDT